VPKERLPVPVEEFLEAAGKDEVLNALKWSDNAQMKALLGYLLQPRPLKFLSACMKAEVTLNQLQDLYSNYQRIAGVMRMSQHIPQVFEDVAIDAKSKMASCPRCDGYGVIEDLSAEKREDAPPPTRRCPVCKGEKEVRVPGDKLARELVFESLEMTGKKGPSVAIQQNFGQPSSIEATIAMTQKLLVQK
jgi:hypothetical protein